MHAKPISFRDSHLSRCRIGRTGRHVPAITAAANTESAGIAKPHAIAFANPSTVVHADACRPANAEPPGIKHCARSRDYADALFIACR